MRSQVAARPVGLLLSLQGTVHPLLMSATYQQLKGLPLDELVAELRRPEVKARVLDELSAPGANLLERMTPAFALGNPPRYDQRPDEAIDLGPRLRRAARGRRHRGGLHPGHELRRRATWPRCARCSCTR